MNYDWDIEVPNQNIYTDRPSVNYAQCVNLLVALYSAKGKASEAKTERGRLLVVLINYLHISAIHSINKSNFHAKDKL